MRIAVLDDRATNRKIFSMLAGSIDDDITVHAFSDPEAALPWLETNTPDLVITDYKMPHMNGAEFIRRFREHRGAAEIPVIAITVYQEREFRLRALEAGATDFLISPVDHDEFKTRVRNLLKMRKQQLLLAERAKSLELQVCEKTRELVKAAKAKDDFLALVSHELRSPLTTINAVIALLDAEKLGTVSATMRKPVKVALSNCQRLIRIVNDILDLTRIGGGTIELNLQTVGLHEILAEVLDSKRLTCDSHDFKLEVTDRARNLHVVADALRLQQVVDNLLTNAVKFSDANSEIALTVDRRDDLLRVSVVDRGIGIPAELHDHVFKPFAQVDSSSTRRAGGVGLGLTIAKAIIEAHRGTIGLSSTEGEGTTVHFDLPVGPDPADSSRLAKIAHAVLEVQPAA